MTQVDKLKFYFVLPFSKAGEDDCTEDMKLAFDCVVKYGGNATWVQPGFCFTHCPSPNSDDIFIFQKFEGKEFEALKMNKNCAVLGARCTLSCISGGRPIPPGLSPVFSEGMRNLVITTSGFSERVTKLLHEKVTYMGGIVDKSLRSVTTHLVASNNLSKKAIESYKSGTSIMKEEWVEEVWKRSLSADVNGGDAEFKKFKSPLFHNLKITTSGLSKKEKEKVKDLISQFGGTFTGELADKCTNLLIISKPEGDKYKFAQSWKIACVKPDWLYDCIRNEVILPLSSYILGSKPKASTPKKGNITNVSANFSMISNIGHYNDRQITHLEESLMTPTGKPRSQVTVKRPAYAIVVDSLVKGVRESGQFLDGCNIFLLGFDLEWLEKLRRVLNLSGAMRSDELSKVVSHIVVGSSSSEDTKALQGVGGYVVSVEWLEYSMRLRRPAPEEKFLLLEPVLKPPAPPSPLSKQGAEIFCRTVQPPDITMEEDEELKQGNNELLSQYNLSHQGEPLKTVEEPPPTPSRCTTLKTESSISDIFFSGLKFYLSRELNQEESVLLAEAIVERGGETVSKRFSGIPDYAVVPIIEATLTDVTSREVVNGFFIKDCCRQGGLVAIQYYHHPVSGTLVSQPLKGCVISVSNYTGSERDFVEMLVESLGAVWQSLLARKAKEKDILKSTHLICAEPTGQKYLGALRWGLPIVHHDWLLECAAVGSRVSEQPFLVGDSKLSTTNDSLTVARVGTSLMTSHITAPSISTTPAHKPSELQAPSTSNAHRSSELQAPSTSNAYRSSELQAPSTPVGHSFQTQDDFNVPHTPMARLVNKAVEKVKLTETPTSGGSPDSNRTVTPTSPYGAFYGKGTPSPATRKRLLKWMNQGIEFEQDPPLTCDSEPRRRQSTPMSEMLSRHLQLMKRKPEDLPPDSPVSFRSKRPALDVSVQSSGDDRIDIPAGLLRLKEIEENYKEAEENSKKSKVTSPPKRSNDSLKSVEDPRPAHALCVEESQPHTEVGWEYPVDHEVSLKLLEKQVLVRKNKVFMLAGFSGDSNESRNALAEASALIEQSGGKVSQLNHFDASATHIVAATMTRAEKLMGSIAAGLWVLHASYLEELRTVKNVDSVREEDHEWGNPAMKDRLQGLSGNSKECAQSSYVWRREIGNGNPPPFRDLKIILEIAPSKYDSFRRLVEAGGGTIVSGASAGATFCIADSLARDKLDQKSLAKQGVCCVTQLFINDYILKKPDAVKNNLIPGFNKFWNK